ncbi:group II intron maturase-specific domain-containing protein [Streptomyces chiangmaiensis]
MKGTVRRITSRTWGVSMAHRMDKLSRFSVGWVAYFGLADTQRAFGEIDTWVRRRLRQVQPHVFSYEVELAPRQQEGASHLR